MQIFNKKGGIIKGKNNLNTNSEGIKFVREQISQYGWQISPTTKKSILKVNSSKTNKQISLKVKATKDKRKFWHVGKAKFDGMQWKVEGIDKNADYYVIVDLLDNAAYIVRTDELIQLVNYFAPIKYDKRGSKKEKSKKEMQPCWINATKRDHQDEWRKIAPLKNKWGLLSEVQ